MISNNLEDYEVLSILGADLNSTCYKVKNKSTSEIFVWKAISYENLTESEKHSLLAQIEKQKLQAHPHIVQVYDYIIQEDTKIIYLISEFCANGNLTSLIHKCLIENEYLSENFLWRILYQIACALKITGSLTQSLTLSSVFVDANYIVKLFNNDMLKSEVHNCDHLQSQNTYFGHIMFELCTLQLQKLANKSSVATTKHILTDIPSYYSNEFKEIIRFTLSTNFDLNAILCHPTILLKSTQVLQNIFIKNPIAKNDQLQERHENANVENTINIKLEADAYQLRLENLKNRETAVKMREERLSMKEHELHKREKKVALMERTVKEKMLHAELYLKRCRESRSTSSGSSKSSSTRAKVNYEHIDTSFSADCGDTSIIIPTSKKMNSENIKKPHNFIRTLSERRVQFKGHSPLKDMFSRNNPKEARILHQPSLHHMTILETSSTTGSETTEGNSTKSDLTSTRSGLTGLTSTNTLPQTKSKSRKKLELSLVLPARNRKPLVDKNVIYEEKEATAKQTEYRPISWTEESKQHAFDLLRIMNQNNENEVVKHTYL